MSQAQSTTQRIFLRGERVNLVVSFFADDAGTVPLVPLDIAEYPAYSIFDINGTVVQSGIGQPEGTPGRWKSEYLVPKDAPLSNDRSRWRIEWTFVSEDNQQFEMVEEFDVKDTVITSAETREISFITLAGQPYRAILRLPEVPADVQMDVFAANNFNTPIILGAMVGLGGIMSAEDGDSIVYYYDIPASVMQTNCVFAIIWKIRSTISEPQQFVYQKLSTVMPNVLAGIISVRHIIDKLGKRLGTVQSYEDSAILEYLQRGHELVNSTYPTTYYQFGQMPQIFGVFHILYSAWYGLQAQYILETDLGFNMSGQTVTLEYDHSGNLSDIAGKWQDFITTNLPPAKMSVFRATSSVGVVAGRGYRYQGYDNMVYRIATRSGNTGYGLIGQLTTMGLLW